MQISDARKRFEQVKNQRRLTLRVNNEYLCKINMKYEDNGVSECDNHQGGYGSLEYLFSKIQSI